LGGENDEAAVVADGGKQAVAGEGTAWAIERNERRGGRAARWGKGAGVAQIDLLHAATGGAGEICRGGCEGNPAAVGTDAGLLRLLIAGTPELLAETRVAEVVKLPVPPDAPFDGHEARYISLGMVTPLMTFVAAETNAALQVLGANANSDVAAHLQDT
jgi:hypothetical protein